MRWKSFGEIPLLIFTFLSFCSVQESGRVNGSPSPVLLVPGDGGSQFLAKLNKPSTVHIYCSKTSSDYFSLWLNLELMIPEILDCFVDNMRLVYDNVTRTTKNSPGVDIKIPGFGNTSSVEWLDPSEISPTAYLYTIANFLVKDADIKLVRGHSLRGAPYDFRKAANENGLYFKNVKRLIEEMYASNNNSKVVLLCHSMGNLNGLYFLNQMTKKWKDTFIKAWITLAGPWGGAAKTLRLMSSGDTLGVEYVVNPLTLRAQQRTMPSTSWMLPYDTFWNEDEVLVTTPWKNYTVNDYPQFFKDLNFETGWDMRVDTEHLIKKLMPPRVEVHCLHGINVDTPAKFAFTKSMWPDDQPKVTNSNGDGTVNLRSLLGCLQWQKQQKEPVYHQTFDKSGHMGILTNMEMMKYIKKVVLS